MVHLHVWRAAWQATQHAAQLTAFAFALPNRAIHISHARGHAGQSKVPFLATTQTYSLWQLLLKDFWIFTLKKAK